MALGISQESVAGVVSFLSASYAASYSASMCVLPAIPLTLALQTALALMFFHPGDKGDSAEVAKTAMYYCSFRVGEQMVVCTAQRSRRQSRERKDKTQYGEITIAFGRPHGRHGRHGRTRVPGFACDR